MARIHGNAGQVYISTGTSSTGTLVGNLTEWELSNKKDKVDVSAMGDANKQYVIGLKDLTGTFSGWFNTTDQSVFTAADVSAGVNIAIYPTVGSTFIFRGPAYLDISADGGVSKGVGIKGSFSAAGAWYNASTTASS